jgi:hypothetical protein
MSRSQGTHTTGDRAAREVSQRFGGSFTTITLIAALSKGALTDGQIFFAEDTQAFWEYVAASTATAGDDAVTPTGTGVAGMFLRATNGVRRTLPVALTDASPTILVTAGKRRVMPAATLSTNRTVTLGTTGAVTGDEIEIIRQDVTANTLAVVNGGAGAGTIATLPASKTGFVRAYFDGTNWLYLAAANN